MKLLRNLVVGDEVFVEVIPGLSLILEKQGTKFEYTFSGYPRRKNRKSPELKKCFGLILSNTDFILSLRPLLENTHTARFPYNTLQRVFVFTGLTNEDTMIKGRVLVVGSSFSSRRGFGWDPRRNVRLPQEQPQSTPAERLFEEVLIG